MKNTTNKLILVAITINCLSFLNMNIFNIYSKICYYFNFVILALVFFSGLSYKMKLRKFNKYTYIIVFLVYAILSIMITDGGGGSAITIIYSLLIFVMYSYSFLTRNNLKYLMYLFSFLSFFIYIRSYGYFSLFISNKTAYINTNTMGMMALFTSMYSIIINKHVTKKNNFIFMLIEVIFCIVSLINYECRGSLLAMTFFLLFYIFIPRTIWKSKKFIMILFILIVGIGTIFPFIYSDMYINGVNIQIPIINKGLYTGRELIWINTIRLFGNDVTKWLFGIGSKVVVWDKDMNLHNNYFAVITNFGLIGYSFYYSFFFIQITNIIGKASAIQIDFLISFFALLVLSYVEVVTLWTVLFLISIFGIGMACDTKFLKNNAEKISGGKNEN